MKKTIYILTLAVALMACKKSKEEFNKNPILEGTYRGTLKYEYSYEPILEETVVEVIFKNGRYEVTEANFGKGAIGSFKFGNYMDKSVIEFKDIKAWQQDFDIFKKHLILDGNYQYEVKEDNLILTKMPPYERVAFGFYQYKLKLITK